MFEFKKCPGDEKRIERELQVKSQIQWMRWKFLEENISKNMNYRYRKAYPEFPVEISQHGEQGVAVLSALLPEEVLVSLNCQELIIIMVACYIHDIGLVTNTPPYRPLPHKEHFIKGSEFIFNEKWLDMEKEEKKIL